MISHPLSCSQKLSFVWIAATIGTRSLLRRTTLREIKNVNLKEVCEQIGEVKKKNSDGLQFRHCAILLVGVVRLYAQKCNNCLVEASSVSEKTLHFDFSIENTKINKKRLDIAVNNSLRVNFNTTVEYAEIEIGSPCTFFSSVSTIDSLSPPIVQMRSNSKTSSGDYLLPNIDTRCIMLSPEKNRIPLVCEFQNAPAVNFLELSPMHELWQNRCFSPFGLVSGVQNGKQETSNEIIRPYLWERQKFQEKNQQSNLNTRPQKRKKSAEDHETTLGEGFLVKDFGPNSNPRGFAMRRHYEFLRAPLFENVDPVLGEFYSKSLESPKKRGRIDFQLQTPEPWQYDHNDLEIETVRRNKNPQVDEILDTGKSNNTLPLTPKMPWDPSVYSQISSQLNSFEDLRPNSNILSMTPLSQSSLLGSNQQNTPSKRSDITDEHILFDVAGLERKNDENYQETVFMAYIEDLKIQSRSTALYVDDIVNTVYEKRRQAAAKAFFLVLGLATKGLIHVSQKTMFGDIEMVF